MPAMVSYSHRLKSGHLTCYLNRTYHVLTTVSPEDSGAKCDVHGNAVTVSLDYLNPFRDHKQLLQISILVDGDTDNIKIGGSGEGWSVRHIPLPTPGQLLYREIVKLATVVIPMGINILISRFAQKHFGIGGWEVSWRAAPWAA